MTPKCSGSSGTPPAFQFYAGDFMRTVIAWSPEQRGCYISLLCHQWTEGSIPSDEASQARICGLNGGRIADALAVPLAKFDPVEGDPSRMVNRRLERVRAEQDEYRAKQADRGRIGAKARWGKDGTRHSKRHSKRHATANGVRQWPQDGTPSPRGDGPSASHPPPQDSGERSAPPVPPAPQGRGPDGATTPPTQPTSIDDACPDCRRPVATRRQREPAAFCPVHADSPVRFRSWRACGCPDKRHDEHAYDGRMGCPDCIMHATADREPGEEG